MSLLALVLAVPALLVPIRPDDTPLERAQALVKAGDSAGAIEVLDEALADGGPGSLDVGLMLAGLQIGAGDPQGALHVLDELKANDDARVCSTRGRAYMAWADQIYATEGASEDMQLMLADGRAQFERAVELAGAELGPQVELGYVRLYRFGEADDVHAFATQALVDHPDDGELLLLRGCAGAYVYWNAKQGGDTAAADASWTASVTDLKKATQKLPRERIEPWGQLVWFYEDRGMAVDAVEAAVAVVDRQPEPDFSTLYRLAVRYATDPVKSYPAAGRALERIVASSARDLTARLRQEQDLVQIASALGVSIDPYVKRQDIGTARTILQAIVAADPPAPNLWNDYAFLCEQASRFEEACDAYQKIIDIDPNNARAYNDLGSVLHNFLNRDLDRAKELYQKCIDLANEQLLDEKLTKERRDVLPRARTPARDNPANRAPAASAGGLLEGLLEGLSGLNLPETPAEGDGSAAGGEGEGSTGTGDDGSAGGGAAGGTSNG